MLHIKLKAIGAHCVVKRCFHYFYITSLISFFFVHFIFVEKGEPRSAGGGQAQHPSQKDSGREDEKADAERRVLEKKRGGGALENGDAV